MRAGGHEREGRRDLRDRPDTKPQVTRRGTPASAGGEPNLPVGRRALRWSTGAQVRRLFLGEGAFLAATGSLIGIPLGLAFAKALVWGLGSAWSGAVADAAIEFHARGSTAPRTSRSRWSRPRRGRGAAEFG